MIMPQKKAWWEKPGLGIMFQIEARPGWLWSRNYEKFNASMMDKNGNLNFNGPFCQMKEWVKFSSKIGVDYHIFEAKWHDGICYFDTKYTNWKTPEDYCKIFAEASRKAGIPFMFYYSSVFDHNPQFDAIQPLKTCTPSYFALNTKFKPLIAGFSFVFSIAVYILFMMNRFKRRYPKDKTAKWFDHFYFPSYKNDPRKYERYMLSQLIEMIGKYKPDGMWMDWYLMNLDISAHRIMDLMQYKFPNVILTFNLSSNSHLKGAHYTSGEAHDIKTAWSKGNKYRNKKSPWELVGPAASAWDNPLPRPDPYDAARIAVLIMASGGKFAFGMPAQMNGALYPTPARHLEIFGAWYKQKRELFTEATPMNYKGKQVPGVKIKEQMVRSIGTRYENDLLLHLIHLKSIPKKDLEITLSNKYWARVEKILLAPDNEEVDYQRGGDGITLTITKEKVDPVDDILKIQTGG